MKYKQRKDKQNNHNAITSKTVLIIFSICIPITLCIAECLFNYWNINKIINICNGKSIEHTTISEVMQLDIVNTGISVIAIAVSVWIGLNIYNNCRESELEKELENLKKENSKLARERIKSLFLLELKKTEDDYEVSAYFSVRFNFEEDISAHILEKLIIIEKDFCTCCKAYENKDQANCLAYAKKVLKGLKSLKEGINTNELLNIYKDIRYSDALFYKNMVLTGKNRKELIKSNKIYKNVIKKLEMGRKKLDTRTKSLIGYLANSVGFVYLVLYKSFPKDDDNYLNNAYEFLRKAVENNPKGRYYQNLGAYYEANTKDPNRYKDAINQYEKALVAENRDAKVYNLLGSAYLKNVEKELEIDIRFDHKKLLKDYHPKEINESHKENIISAYVWLSRAVTVTPQLIDVYYNFGKANFYYWKLIDKNDVEKKECAKRYIDLAYNINQDSTGALFTLRNYYEITGDIKSAKEVNLKLNGKGDAKKAEAAYDAYLNKRQEQEPDHSQTKNFVKNEGHKQ